MAYTNPNPENASEAIRKNLHFLCTNSKSEEPVLTILIEQSVFTDEDKDTVMSKSTSYSRFFAVYDMIRKKVSLPTTYPSLIDALNKTGNDHIVQQLEETLNVLEGLIPAEPMGPESESEPELEPQQPVSAVLKERLSGVELAGFLDPIMTDVYESTQTESFMDELHEKKVINLGQKEHCAGIDNEEGLGQNEFLYRIAFMKNDVNGCIDALDNPENNHILEMMFDQLEPLPDENNV